MKKILRGTTLLLAAAVLAVSVPVPAFSIVAEETVIVIRTEEDLQKLGRACISEVYSEGKTVSLEADLNFEGMDFEPIPVFCGIFEGNGHTVSGISIRQSGSGLGMFRYLEEEAVVQNLNVSGELKPEGSRKKIGGIAGTNKGKIQNCTFSGSGEALENLGGIAGINEETGVIDNCLNQADLTGNRRIGGIAGENIGSVLNSSNEGEINTTSEGLDEDGDEKNTVSVNREDLHTTIVVEKVYDVGGIAGISSGSIRQCTNSGPIGYERTGYNIGGIVGRQTGLLLLCENEGAVTGRKDVGGLAGQLEPLLTIQYGEDTLDRIHDQVDQISDTTDAMRQDLRDTTDATIGNLDRVDEIMKEIRDITRGKKDSRRVTRDEFSEDAGKQLDQIDEILANMEFDLGSRSAERAAGRVRANVKRARELLNNLGSSAGGAIGGAISGIGGGGGQDGAGSGNAGSGGSQGGTGTGSGSGGSQGEAGAGSGSTGSGENQGEAGSGNAGSDGNQDSTGTGNMAGSIGDRITLPSDYIFDEDAGVLGELQYLYEVLKELQECAGSISDDTEIMIGNGISGVVDGVRDFEDDLDSLRVASKELLDMTRDYKDQLLDDVDGLDEDVTQQLDQLYDELDYLSDNLKSGKDQLRTEADRLSEQMDGMHDIIEEGKDRFTSERDKVTDDQEPVFEDISETATDLAEGMIIGCTNRGDIFSDFQAGGVVGTIGIELDLDPEEDIETYGEQSLYMNRYAQAAVRQCRNEGTITVRQDYAGGIAGSARIGVLASNQNYGDVNAVDGDYTGGIAGSSQSLISGSYVMCQVEGNHYTGGIAGWGKNLRGNCAMVSVVADEGEWKGSIAGDRDEDGQVSQNLYVEDGLGAVDGITFRGEAEGITYETLLEKEDLPSEFHSLTVTFLADEQVVEQIVCKYGQSLAEEHMPKVPKKEGFFEQWENVDLSDIRKNYKVHAVYHPWTTTIASSHEPMPLLLAEAAFYPEAQLYVQEHDSKELETMGLSFPTGWRGIKACTYSIQDSQNESVLSTARIHVLANKADGVGIVKNGAVERVEAVRDGDYLIFDAGTSGQIVLLKSFPVFGIAIAAVLVLAALGIVIGKGHLTRKTIPDSERDILK